MADYNHTFLSEMLSGAKRRLIASEDLEGGNATLSPFSLCSSPASLARSSSPFKQNDVASKASWRILKLGSN